MRKNPSLIHSLEKPEKDNFIYALCYPDTEIIFYIGLSTTGYRRIVNHYNCCYRGNSRNGFSNVKRKISSLKKQNQIFKVVYLEYFDNDGQHLDEAEIFWIGYFKMLGCELLNHDNGGRRDYKNYNNHLEIKLKRSISAKKTNGSPEKVEFFREHTRQTWQNPEIRERRINGATGVKKSIKGCENIRKGQTEAFGVKIQDDSGNIFNSIREAANFYNVPRSAITQIIYAKSRKYSHIKLKKISGGRKDSTEIKLGKYYIKKGPGVIINPIQDQFGNIYTNITEASKQTGISLRVVHRILKGEIKNPKKGIFFTYMRKVA